MASGDVASSKDPADRAQILYEDPRTRVTRRRLAGQTVICKEPLGDDADRRLRHEVAMVRRLREVPATAHLAEQIVDGCMVLADAGETNLAARSPRHSR